MNMLREIFTKVDVIVTPTTGITAPKIPKGALSKGISDYTTSGLAMKFIFLANGLGIPAVSCPIGFDSGKMPIGIQFQAKWYKEDLLLRLAHVSEILHRDVTGVPSEVYNLLD
jgi:Asp-tRNA(Asn)/Glu-tRNA(Gln) amidotransferase A subunit family amidase